MILENILKMMTMDMIDVKFIVLHQDQHIPVEFPFNANESIENIKKFLKKGFGFNIEDAKLVSNASNDVIENLDYYQTIKELISDQGDVFVIRPSEDESDVHLLEFHLIHDDWEKVVRWFTFDGKMHFDDIINLMVEGHLLPEPPKKIQHAGSEVVVPKEEETMEIDEFIKEHQWNFVIDYSE